MQSRRQIWSLGLAALLLAGGRARAADDYLVIDLAEGPEAKSYPISYLNAAPADGWTDEYKTTKLVLRRIPAGTFTMGSPANELERDANEVQHQVTLTKDFYLGVFEVTQKQWERVMGRWPSHFTNSVCRDTRPVEQVSYLQIRERGEANKPLALSWPQTAEVGPDSFMGKLRARTKLATLDLPTEAQWEYACRAGRATALNSGQDLTGKEPCPNLSAVGRYWENGGQDHSPGCQLKAGTAAVGSYQPNKWGLYDLHGNVWEWCLDAPGKYPGAVKDPVGPEPEESPGTIRVQRGGSWYDGAGFCRAATRYSLMPLAGSNSSGLRLAMTPP